MLLKKASIAAPFVGLMAATCIGISVVPLLSAASASTQGFAPTNPGAVCKGPQCGKKP